jgi:predicted aldo/keto reductase-like oxidoreductase
MLNSDNQRTLSRAKTGFKITLLGPSYQVNDHHYVFHVKGAAITCQACGKCLLFSPTHLRDIEVLSVLENHDRESPQCHVLE